MVQHTDRVYLDEPLLSVMVLSSRIAYGKSASSGMTGSSALSAKVPCPISRLLGAPILPTSPTLDGGNVYCSIATYTLQSIHLPHVQCYQAYYKWHSFLFAGVQPRTLCSYALKTSPQRLCENYNYVHSTFYANYKGARCINKISHLEVEAF